MKIFPTCIKILLTGIIISLPLNTFSQNNSEPICGTVTTSETLDYLNTLKPQSKNYEAAFMSSKKTQKNSKSVSNNYITIKAHIIRNTNGEGGLDASDLENAITHLNVMFADAYLEFVLDKNIHYIDNDSYCQFKSNNEPSLVDQNYQEGMLNIYFTNYLENASNENICGYTYIKKDYDVIMMQNDCLKNDSSLAHEIGHFLSLMHTHGIDNNERTKEFVNGTNCSEEGDQICDTPADPKLTVQNVNNFCRYIGTATDCHGDLYMPDTKNIMSYALKGCRSHFSEQQFSRMYAYYMSAKSYLIRDHNNDLSETTETKIYPNPVKGNWLYIKQTGAEHYNSFEISNLMGQRFISGTLTKLSIHLDQLASGTYLITLRNDNAKMVKRIIK